MNTMHIYIYASPPPPPKTHILTPWQMFMCQSIVFHVDVEELQEFRRYFDSLADVHVSEHCFPCWCGGVTGIQKIFWLLGRCSCVRALFSMLMWRSYRNSEDILTPWQMFMCQSIVFHVDHHLTSSVHIIPFSLEKKSCFTERLFVHIEDSSLQATSLFEKVRSSKKEGYFALKKSPVFNSKKIFLYVSTELS